jgi:isoleucyl-tRNA synthetase
MSKFQINLPKTAFSMKANLPIREPEILKYWEEINLYQELRNSRKGNEKFILHDGPPMQMEIFIWVLRLTRYLKIS